MKKILINYDFVNGKELSYFEGLNSSKNFQTNTLLFFNLNEYDVTVKKKNGEYINNQELLCNTEEFNYTDKEIRPEHNLLKMLIAGAFFWRPIKEGWKAIEEYIDQNVDLFSSAEEELLKALISLEEKKYRRYARGEKV